MDRQVSKINKSDGRDRFWKCYSAGREAYRTGFQGPLNLSKTALLEWIYGWNEEKEKNVDNK